MKKSFNKSRSKEKGGGDPYFTIRRTDQIRCLMSQVRQEIVDTVEALGTCSIGEIAEHLGRSADGLYYHVRALLETDLLEQRGFRDGGRQPEAMYAIKPCAASLRLHYDPADPENVAAVSGVVSSMLRVAERDFGGGFVPGVAVCRGPERNLWAARRRGWLSAEDLREVNCLLERLTELLGQGKASGRERLYALTYVIAPVEAHGRRRQKTER
jgi:predicted transcriptional regulator